MSAQSITAPTKKESGTAVQAAPLLSLHDVTVSYEQGTEPVLQEIDFTVCEGEAVLLMGPSGCGKSTLAMLCAKLIPHSVEATVTGALHFSSRLQEPGSIGYVFQDPDAQFCMLQVADEVAFGLENRGIARAEMPARIASALAQSGSHVPWSAQHALFSGGMKQKLAIAAALAQSPALLVLDEPTANLDPFSTRQVFDQIGSLRNAGQTLIVIEHKFDALLPLMDRVILFDRSGRIYRHGPTLPVVREEWDWLVREGVIATWKRRPAMEGDAHQTDDDKLCASARQLSVPDAKKVWSPIANSDSEPVVSLSEATIGYAGQTVLSSVNLSIAKGDFVAIVGPNGAGKSSLLQVMAGLTKVKSGTVTLLGRPMRNWKPKDRFRALAYSFQNPEFQFIYERVGDELANRIVGEQIPQRVKSLLTEFGLAGLEQQSPFALSQGQKRRLSVAAMLRDEHELFLFDEPTFGQDARTQRTLLEHMCALNAQQKTIILTTHDMDLVRQYAKRVIVVAHGGILFSGTPTELFAREDIQATAHLQDDQYQKPQLLGVAAKKEPCVTKVGDAAETFHALQPPVATAAVLADTESLLCDQNLAPQKRADRKTPVQRLNPAWLFLSMLAAAVISLSAHTLAESLTQLSLPLLVMIVLGWMTPWRILKLLSPFLIFYVLYFWTYVANSAVAPGTASYHILWYNLSWVGVQNGLILSIRMLGSVLFGILFVTQIDITEFMVALTRNLFVPPRFAYGAMAGLRVVPLFSSEWTKLRQARQIRSRESASPVLRAITYALPLLSQGIRMSERVAIAMEARGFVGLPATSARHRTFYRDVTVRWWDYVISLTIVLCALLGVLLVH